jgi:hypothetical protein
MTEVAESPCIIYEHAKNRDGYGILSKKINGSRLAHRAALSKKLGRPVEGVTRHTCDNPPCINPDHLLEGTHADNSMDRVLRGRTYGHGKNNTHCKHGHEFTPENTLIRHRKGRLEMKPVRVCKTCSQAWNKELAAKRKAARNNLKSTQQKAA